VSGACRSSEPPRVEAPGTAAEGVQANAIGRGHDRFSAAKFARPVRTLFRDKGRGVCDAEVRLPDEIQVGNALGKMLQVRKPSSSVYPNESSCWLKKAEAHHVLEGAGVRRLRDVW